MSMAQTATSISAANEESLQPWPLLPVETEIYILPDGRVVVADLPAELAPLLAALGIATTAAAATATETGAVHG
ncbi:MAG: hypothetical protein KF832_30270 [Caldilineaceae bacterium]|nr:hypothetical protein [Caldilineaceae bacterium]